MSLGDHAYTVLKDRRKKRRVLIQFIILLLVLLGIFYAFFFLKSYTPYAEDEESSTLNTGFIGFYNLFWGAKVTVQMRVLSAPTFFSIKK